MQHLPLAAAAGSQVLAQQRAHLLLLLQEEEEEEASPLAQLAQVAGRAERLHSARLRRQRRAASGLEPLPRPRNHSARPLRQHPAASRSEVAEARPRQRLAARQPHLAGGGASPSEPPCQRRLVGLVGLVVVVGAAKEGVRLRPPSAPLRLLLEARSAAAAAAEGGLEAAAVAAVLAMRAATCHSARWSRPSGPSHKRRGEQEEEQEQEQTGVAHAVASWVAGAADGALTPLYLTNFRND